MSLTTKWAGFTLKSPILAASAPPTESAQAIAACARAGAGAVVTKSIADYDRSTLRHVPRRSRRDRRGISIQGSFTSETLTLAEGVRVVAEAKSVVNIPIIASVGVLDVGSGRAFETAMRLAEAGADMIHYDLFYLPQPRCSDGSLAGIDALFEQSNHSLGVPFGAKFNLDLPAHAIASRFDPRRCSAWFVLDSVRVPPPLDAEGRSEKGVDFQDDAAAMQEAEDIAQELSKHRVHAHEWRVVVKDAKGRRIGSAPLAPPAADARDVPVLPGSIH